MYNNHYHNDNDKSNNLIKFIIMEKFVKRMIDEHKALNVKIVKLNNMLNAIESGRAKVALVEYGLLKQQRAFMELYADVIADRLNFHGIIIKGDGKEFSYFEQVDNQNVEEESK